MIDLTEITDKVARATWDGTQPPREPDIDFDQLHPHEQLTIKSALLPTISKTAELVEAEVRQQIVTQLEVKRAQAREAAQQSNFVGYGTGRADALDEALDVIKGRQ